MLNTFYQIAEFGGAHRHQTVRHLKTTFLTTLDYYLLHKSFGFFTGCSTKQIFNQEEREFLEDCSGMKITHFKFMYILYVELDIQEM